MGISLGTGMPIETALTAAATDHVRRTRTPAGGADLLAHDGGALPAIIGRLDKGATIIGVSADSPTSRVGSPADCGVTP